MLITMCETLADGAEEAMLAYSRRNNAVVTGGEMLQRLWPLTSSGYREHWLLRCRLAGRQVNVWRTSPGSWPQDIGRR